MIMARTKLTEQEKLERKIAKKAEAKAKREAERQARWDAQRAVWDQQAAESREKILQGLDTEFRGKFEKALEQAAKSANEFLRDLHSKWMRYGNLSEKQMSVMINSCERDKKRAVVAEVIEDWFKVGEKAELSNLTVIKVEKIRQDMNYGSDYVTRVTMKNRPGVFFTVKTNAGRLIDVFQEALDNQQQVKVVATVKWHYQDSDTVILTSRGLKVQIQNV